MFCFVLDFVFIILETPLCVCVCVDTCIAFAFIICCIRKKRILQLHCHAWINKQTSKLTASNSGAGAMGTEAYLQFHPLNVATGGADVHPSDEGNAVGQYNDYRYGVWSNPCV